MGNYSKKEVVCKTHTKRLTVVLLAAIVLLNCAGCNIKRTDMGEQQIAETFAYTAQENPYNYFGCDDKYIYFYYYDATRQAYICKCEKGSGKTQKIYKLPYHQFENFTGSSIYGGLCVYKDRIFFAQDNGIYSIDKNGKEKVKNSPILQYSVNQMYISGDDLNILTTDDYYIVDLSKGSNFQEKDLKKVRSTIVRAEFQDTIYTNGSWYTSKYGNSERMYDEEISLLKDDKEILTYYKQFFVTHNKIYLKKTRGTTPVTINTADLNGNNEAKFFDHSVEAEGNFAEFLNYDEDSVYFCLEDKDKNRTYYRITEDKELIKYKIAVNNWRKIHWDVYEDGIYVQYIDKNDNDYKLIYMSKDGKKMKKIL